MRTVTGEGEQVVGGESGHVLGRDEILLCFTYKEGVNRPRDWFMGDICGML